MTLYAFLIHSIESVGLVFYSRFYTGEGNDHAKGTRQQTIVRRVVEDKSFHQNAIARFPTKLNLATITAETLSSLTLSKKVTDYHSTIPSDNSALPSPSEGVVIIACENSVLFETDKVAVWRICGDMILTTVCDPRDNLTLISSNMGLIMEHLCRRLGQHKLQQRIINEPEEIEAVLSQYVHNGCPLLANYALHRFMALAEDADRPYID